VFQDSDWDVLDADNTKLGASPALGMPAGAADPMLDPKQNLLTAAVAHRDAGLRAQSQREAQAAEEAERRAQERQRIENERLEQERFAREQQEAEQARLAQEEEARALAKAETAAAQAQALEQATQDVTSQHDEALPSQDALDAGAFGGGSFF
jgi:hypothetical protein